MNPEENQCPAAIRIGGVLGTEVLCIKDKGHRPIGATNGHQSNVRAEQLFGDRVADIYVEVKW